MCEDSTTKNTKTTKKRPSGKTYISEGLFRNKDREEILEAIADEIISGKVPMSVLDKKG